MNDRASSKVCAWPSKPYKGLAYYGPDDAPLFVGRQGDVNRCVAYLAEPATRVLLLYGQSGCGKSSFLRAGLIPALEERGFGYHFLRLPSGPGKVTSPYFIRCGVDPVRRIAETVYAFASQPQMIWTADGPNTVDLSHVIEGYRTIESFVEACAQDFLMLPNVLRAIPGALQHTLVVVVDQVEEIISLTGRGSPNRVTFGDFVKEIVGSRVDINVKVILAFRKEYFGELFSLVQLGASMRTDVKHFLLDDLPQERVLAAMVLPTANKPILEGKSPFDEYKFRFAPGVADAVVTELFKQSPEGGVLPVMQIVCRDLYNALNETGPTRTIQAAPNGDESARITGCVERHISDSIRMAAKAAGAGGRALEREERIWRKRLCGLVKRSADGRCKSDLVAPAYFDNESKPKDERSDLPAGKMIELLSQPEVLILRKVSTLTASDGQERVEYSLGHDAIALALHEMKVGEDRVRRAAYRLWFQIGRRAALLLVVALLVAAIITINRRIKVLNKVAEDTQRGDVVLALHAATQAMVYQRLLFWQDGTRARRTTAAILARVPAFVSPAGPGKSSDVAIITHRPPQFVTWDDVGASVSALDTANPDAFAKANVRNYVLDQPLVATKLPAASQQSPQLQAQAERDGTLLVLLRSVNLQDSTNTSQLLALRDDHAAVVDRRSAAVAGCQFVAEGKVTSISEDLAIGSLQSSYGYIYSACTYGRTTDGHDSFAPGAQIVINTSGGAANDTPDAWLPLWIQSGVLLEAAKNEDGAGTLNQLRGIDLHVRDTTKPRWNSQVPSDAVGSNCIAGYLAPRGGCSFSVLPLEGDSGSFALVVKRSTLAAGDTTSPLDAGRPVELVMIGAVSGVVQTIPWERLNDIPAEADATSQADSASPGDDSQGEAAFVDAEDASAFIGVRRLKSVDIFRSTHDELRFIGTILDTDQIDFWVVAQHESSVRIIGGASHGQAKEWTVDTASVPAKSPTEPTSTYHQLRARVCPAIGSRAVDPQTWRDATGLSTDPPKLCAKK
jgi:hypothetical protein